MTDKELKDWCKTCDVEPPAMKFKCPECKHNPDKEQIKCKYKFLDKEKFDGKPYCTCFCELCEELPLCDDNCQIYEDFKQLARKTQECELLETQLESYHIGEPKLIQRIQELEQECDELESNEDMLITKLQVLWGKQIAEEQGDCKNIDYSRPITNKIYNRIQEIEATLKDVVFAQSVKMGKTQPLGDTGSPRSYKRWEKRERMLLEREFLK